MNANLKDAKILIVDDQTANIELLQSLLTANGYFNIKSLTDPRKALDTIKTFNPDLLLLDLTMPHLSGFEIMEMLNTEGLITGFMPVLILTADTSEESMQKALSGGASDFITKPFDLTEVELRIKNLLLTVYLLSQLNEHNINLEEKVKERTAELQLLNTELISAKNKAEEMNKLKSFFLSNISHEFRTPLISILGFSEMLMSESENSAQIESARFIYEAGQRLQKSLNDIIALTEIESKKMELSFETFSLIKYLQAFCIKYKERAENKGITFDLITGSKEILLNADQHLLTEILNNVIDNAIKFTSEGGITISTSSQLEKKRMFAVITISDTGIGILPENIEKVFFPFKQESEGLNRAYEGLGVGLSVAKQLTEILHGEISIKSNIGRGTTLMVKLPLSMSETEVSNKIVQTKNNLNELVKIIENDKPLLLLVEDNKMNRVLFNRMLSKEFLIHEAADGITAVAMAEVKEYDLILMDINLGPGIDGVEALSRIRKIPGREKVPVIAVTAYAMREDRQKFLNYGFSDYIQKPVIRDEFLRVLKSHSKGMD